MPDQPSASVESIEGARTVVLREPATGSEVHVVADVGSNVARFRTRVGGREVEVLAAPPDMATLRERPTRWGSAPLFPYPGRIEGGRFTFDGREVTLPVDARDGNAIHGVARARPWRVISTAADADGASVVTRLGTAEEEIPAAEWPFRFELTLTTRLRGGVLRVETEVANTGDRSMPMGLGFHPYFPTPLGPQGEAEAVEVWVEATERWAQRGAGLPTGEIAPIPEGGELRRPRALRDIAPTTQMAEGSVRNMLFGKTTAGASDAPGGISAGLRDPQNGVAMTLSTSAGFGALVFFTPASPPLVSLEPHTCVPNAFNLANRGLPTGMVVLGPGARWRGWYQIEASPI